MTRVESVDVSASTTSEAELALAAVMPAAQLTSLPSRFSCRMTWTSLGELTMVGQEHHGFKQIAVVDRVPQVVVTMPLVTALDASHDGGTSSVGRGGLYVSNVGDAPVLDSAPHSAFLSVVIPPQTLRTTLDRYLPHRTIEVPGFERSVPVKYSKALASALLHIRRMMGERAARSPVSAERMAGAVLSALLFSYPHSLTGELFRSGGHASDAAVWDAVSRIRAHPEVRDPIAAIARDADLSIRSLQLGFHRLLGVSPSEYVRDARLDLARRLLTRAENAGVSAIAIDVGYVNQGRFARDFADRFGELPSAALRRTRGNPPEL